MRITRRCSNIYLTVNYELRFYGNGRIYCVNIGFKGKEFMAECAYTPIANKAICTAGLIDMGYIIDSFISHG